MTGRTRASGCGRLGAILVLAAVLVAGCTSTDADGSDGNGGEATDAAAGGATGDTAIIPGADATNVAVIQGDTEALQEAGVVPETGDVASKFRLFAERANQEGGAAGRQLNVTIHEFPVPGGATEQREACVAATEETQAFIVVFVGGAVDETTLCVTEEHTTIGISLGGVVPGGVFDASSGRLFTENMSADRIMRNWVVAADEHGFLDDATIGIVRPDDSAHEEVADVLTRALEEAGFEVTEDVALPCEALSQTCEQIDVGAQRLQTSGVDTVFSLLGALAYPSFVGAAGAIGYEPQWLSSDYENQVYAVTATLFEGQKELYDGAIGFSTSVFIDEPDAPRTECNDYYESTGGQAWEPLSDGWSAVGNMCLMVDDIVAAANAAEDAGGLNQASFIEQYEQGEVVRGENQGSYRPGKHDAFDTYQLYEFSSDCTCWEPIDGSAGVAES